MYIAIQIGADCFLKYRFMLARQDDFQLVTKAIKLLAFCVCYKG